MNTDRKILRPFEAVKVESVGGQDSEELRALVDTGARISSIDKAIAEKLGLLSEENTEYEDSFHSALGRQSRPVVRIVFWLSGKKIESIASVADRSGRKTLFLVGRNDLIDFVVQVEPEDCVRGLQ